MLSSDIFNQFITSYTCILLSILVKKTSPINAKKINSNPTQNKTFSAGFFYKSHHIAFIWILWTIENI